MELETLNLTSCSIDQVIRLQSRAPHIPALSRHPHSSPFLIPYTHFSLEDGHKGEGKEGKTDFSQAYYHRG